MLMRAPAVEPVPRHVAMIMDGNRRWATANGLPLIAGYRRGITALRAAVRGAIDAGVEELTVYGFSTENWQRDPAEISMLMKLCAIFARHECSSLVEQGVRVGILGDVAPFALPARTGLKRLCARTERNVRLRLNLALNYSGRAEIVRAARAIAQDVAAGRLKPDDVDERAIRARTFEPGMRDPDLLIRTGGDSRISNFLLYQVAYTEFLSLPLMWPDFTAQHFAQAIREFGLRRRRFGA